MSDMVNVKINGFAVQVPKGSSVLEAAREEENVEARVALSDYHMAYVLFWKKVMPE